VFFGGNFYGVEPDISRHDASYGYLMMNAGSGYRMANNVADGLILSGEIRKMVMINGKLKLLIVVQNNGPLQIFSLGQGHKISF